MADEFVRRFARLFAGRKDVYGADHGGCVKQPLKIGHFERHLSGQEPIGIYPLTDDGFVHWGASDIDVEAPRLAWNLRAVLDHLGIPAFVEKSRSKGYHVWVFADDWLPAGVMRGALLAAHQIADVPAVEVNPKQTTTEGLGVGIGNYIRLPYPGWGSGGRQVVLDPDGGSWGIPCDEFVERAEQAKVEQATLEAAADLWVPPPPPRPVDVDREFDGNLEPLRKKLNSLANHIFLNGPREGDDRSGTLIKLVINASESGLEAKETWPLLVDADRRWGKFFDRHDGEEQLYKILQMIYS